MNESELVDYLRQRDFAEAQQAYKQRQAQTRHDAVRDGLAIGAIDAGMTGWQMWRATGDPEKVRQAVGVSVRSMVGAWVLAVPLTLGFLGTLGAFFGGQADGHGPAAAAPWALAFALGLWGFIALLRWRKRTLRAIAGYTPTQQPIEATHQPIQTSTDLVHQGQQYTFDVHTGIIHKNW